jgi:hypothetical protein
MESTINTYLKAMSKAKQASKVPSAKIRPQSARKKSKTAKTDGKGDTHKHGVQDMLDKSEVKEQEVDDAAEEGYEISHIVLHDDSRGERYYLVAWKGYEVEDATWLTESELEDAQEVLQEYLLGLAENGVD